MKPIVSLIKVGDIGKSVPKAMGHLEGMESVVFPGAKLMIKPNFIGALPPRTGAAFDPKIIEELARLALQAGASRVLYTPFIKNLDPYTVSPFILYHEGNRGFFTPPARSQGQGKRKIRGTSLN